MLAIVRLCNWCNGLDHEIGILTEMEEVKASPPDGSVLNCNSVEPRPPLYNAEDYVLGLRRWGRKGGTRPYIEAGDGRDRDAKRDKKKNISRKEMTMRQLSGVSELLKRLRQDLRMSYPSFVREFVSDPYDGVTGLLDLLKMIQLSQTDYAATMNGTLRSKEHHNFFRRALTDEYDCLLCLKHCLRCEKTAGKLVGYSHGLYTVAVCIMSNFSKSRTLALELLTVACETPPRGHKQVMEAASTLRLRFGEPVRFKFLVGMLTSFGAPSFQLACLRFLNRLTELAEDKKERVHLQAEIEEAGFDVNIIRKYLSNNNETAAVREELDRWQQQYVDVEELYQQLQAERAHTARLRAEKDTLNTELKKHVSCIQTMRHNEDVQSARLQRLESQLSGAPHARASRTNSRTSRDGVPLEPSVGAQAYSSFAPPPGDDAREADVSSTASAMSTLSSLSQTSYSERARSAEKEHKAEEKEKESSEEGSTARRNTNDSAQSRRSPSDFEKEKVCEETIEVKNDMIIFEPAKPRSAASPHQTTLAERRVYQNVPTMPAPCGRRSCEADDIREAMDQLTSVIDNAESTMSMISGGSGPLQVDSLSPPPRKSRGTRERHIVPCRVPMPPGRSSCGRHAAGDQSEHEESGTASSESSQDSRQQGPADRRQSRPSSVAESESTRSFHYARGAALRRRETFAETPVLSSARTSAVQRSGSFHQSSALASAARWCGSVDQLSELEPRSSGGADHWDRRGAAHWSAGPRRARSRDQLAAERPEPPERFQRAAQLRMRRWLEERRPAAEEPATPTRPQRRRRDPEPGSTSGWGSGSGSGSGFGSSDCQESEERRGSGGLEYRLPQTRGFVSRGHRNAGRYSARHLEVPSPDYSSGTLSSVTRMNMSNSIMDLPSALY